MIEWVIVIAFRDHLRAGHLFSLLNTKKWIRNILDFLQTIEASATGLV